MEKEIKLPYMDAEKVRTEIGKIQPCDIEIFLSKGIFEKFSRAFDVVE